MPKVIGTAPYQVPTNADLGSMAYQDSAAVSVELLQADNIRIDGNTISTTDTNGNLVLAPNGTGDVQVDADTLRVGDAGAAATITTNGAGNLVLNTNSGTNAGSITLNQGANTNIEIAPNGTGLTRIVNAGDAIARVERTGATAAQVDVIARSGYGEIRTSAGNLFLNPAGKNVDVGFAADTAALNVTVTSSSSGQTFPQVVATNYSANGGWPAIGLRNSKGTSAAPADIGDAVTLSSIDSWGYGGTSKGFKLVTRIQGVSRGTFAADANVSAGLDFIVTSGNTNATAFRADFDKQMYFYGKVNVDDTTESTSSTTGSTIIDGGLGVAKNIYSGGLIQVDNLRLDGNTLSSQDANGNIVLAPNGTGDVQVDADTLRVGDSGAAATITTNGAGNLTLSTNAGTNSGTIVINQGTNGNIAISPNGSGIVSVSSGMTIGGDLIVNGTTTTVNSTTQTLDDPVLTLGGDTATAETSKDRGVEFKWAGAAITVTSYSSSGTTTVTGTVASTAGYAAGDIITISGATGAEQAKLNGTWTIASVPNATTFTFVTSSALANGTYNTNIGTTVKSKNGFFGLDQSTGKFTFIPQASNASEVFSGTLGDLDVGGAAFANNVAITANNATAALRITQAGAGAALVVEDVASDTTPFTIDANGAVLIGDSAARTYSGGLIPQLQVNGTDGATSSVGILRTGGAAPILHMAAAKGTAASPTALALNDGLLRIRGAGHDGTAYIPSVEILGEVDAATGTNDMPGRLTFSTTADGAATLTERMRIDRNGNVGIGNADPSSYGSQDFRLAVQRDQAGTTRMALINGTSGASAEARFRLIGGTTNSSSDFYLADNTAAPFAGITNGSAVNSFRLAFGANERFRITNAGEVSIGTAGGAVATVLSVYRDITGNANSIGIAQYGTVKSDVVTGAIGIRNNLVTEAASFTLTDYYHFFASQSAIGSGSLVTTQYGFAVQNTLIGAGNNIGFLGNIPLGTTATISNVARTTNVVTITASAAHGFTVGQRVVVAATTNTGVNGTFTIASVPTTTTFTYAQTGADIVSVADTGTSTITGRWNFYASGTAPNYFAGIVQVVNNTASSSTTTGALQVSGGTGIAGDLHVGGTTNSTGDVVISSNTSSTTTTSGALRVTGGAGIAGNLYVGGIIQIDNLRLDTNTISSQDTNGNIVLAPNGTGDVQVDADTLRVGDANAAATITTNGTGNLTLSTNAGTNSGTIVINQGANGNIVVTPNGTGDVQLDADTVRVGDSGAAATITSNGAGALTVTTGGAANLVLNTNSGTSSGSITIANGTNGDITIQPDGTGDVLVNADTLRVGDSGAAATITTNSTGNLTLRTGSTNSGSILINQGDNGNIVVTPHGTGDVQLDADTVRIGDANAAATLTTNGTGNLTISTNAGTDSGTIVINQGTNGNIVVTPNGTGALTVGTSTNTNASKIVSSGTISETVGTTQYLVVSQFDIGTAPNKIPLNQYLGSLAFQNHISGGTF